MSFIGFALMQKGGPENCKYGAHRSQAQFHPKQGNLLSTRDIQRGCICFGWQQGVLHAPERFQKEKGERRD